jgi:hypothetical protein
VVDFLRGQLTVLDEHQVVSSMGVRQNPVGINLHLAAVPPNYMHPLDPSTHGYNAISSDSRLTQSSDYNDET